MDISQTFTRARRRLNAFWQKAADERRGITTSEFWMSLGTILTTVASTLFGIMKPIPAGIITTAIVIGYTLSRGIAKRPKHRGWGDGCEET